jgi:cytochrome P450
LSLNNELILKISDIENEDISSQAFNFFLGGFDTIATAFSFIGHSLAQHPDVQNKVRDEIKMVMEKNGGKITYDSLKELKYMDMVISGNFNFHN